MSEFYQFTINIARTADGLQATFGGRGLTPDDLSIVARDVASELIRATTCSSCRAAESPDADSLGTGKCRP